MRHIAEKTLKEDLRVLAIRERERLGLTQRQMAERLMMSESSYSDIETGKAMCGTLTAVLLLAALEAPHPYLEGLTGLLRESYEKAVLA